MNEMNKATQFRSCFVGSCLRPPPLLHVGISRLFHSTTKSKSLCDYGFEALTSSDPMHKVRLTEQVKDLWAKGDITEVGNIEPPDAPSRPALPLLREKKETPGPKQAGVALNIYLLHSLAHIELNAVDLGWDLILRFRSENLPNDFYTDWISILSDEARHFAELSKRLEASGSFYGSIPSHDALLRDGQATGNDLKTRLAIVQLVHETHGLDSWPRLVQRFNSSNDHESARLVNTICSEEIDHVIKGMKWFKFLCERDGVDAPSQFQEIIRRTKGTLCGPFNKDARAIAGMPESWYVPLERPPRHPPKAKK